MQENKRGDSGGVASRIKWVERNGKKRQECCLIKNTIKRGWEVL